MVDFSNEANDKDVSDMLSLAKPSTPKESAKTIERAERYQMHPDEYDQMSDSLDVGAEIQERTPAQVHDKTKEFMKKSSKHTRVAEPELGILDKIARQADYIWYNLAEKDDLEDQIQELNYKDRTSEEGLNDDERVILDTLYDMRQEEQESFDLEGDEQIPGQIAGVMSDMVSAIGDNKSIIAGSVGTGAAVGGLTPVGPAGAIAGGTLGLGLGVTAALTKDAYYRTADSTFGELNRMKNDDGTPLSIDRESKQNISLAVGATSAAVEGVAGLILTGGIGAIGKRVASKSFLRKLTASPRMLKQYQLFGSMLKSSLSSGGEEVSAEIISILGENYAKLSQDEDADNALMDSIELTYDQVQNDEGIQERLSQTFKIGLGAGAGMTAIAGQTKIEATERQRNKRIKHARKIVETQNNVLQTALSSNQTELKKVAPKQMMEYRKNVFSESEGTFSFNEEDIKTIAESDPELAEKLRSKDISKSSEESTSSGVILYPHDFLELVEDAPTVSEYARLNPQAPNANESKQFLRKLEDAQNRRNEILQSLDSVENMTDEQRQTLQDLDKIVQDETDPEGIEAYVNEFELPEAAKEVMTEKQRAAYEKAQRNTREKVAEQMWDEFDRKEQQIQNRVLKANEKIEKERIEREYSEQLKLTEKFRGEPKVKIEGHSRKGYSANAIDPATLPEDMRDVYLDDPKLSKFKVFVEGGISLEESAAINGFESGQEMLRSIMNTPTRQEMVDIRKNRISRIKEQVEETRAKTYEKRLNEMFDDVSKLHKQEMDLMKTDEWAQTKSGFKKVNLSVPKIGEINNRARGIVKNTRVDALSPRQFNASERKLQIRYNDNITKNEVEQAFLTKEKSILNSELTRESLKAKNRINLAKKFVKKLRTPRIQKALKSSGLKSQVDEILGVFNLDVTNNGQLSRRQDSFADYVRKKELNGESITIPESLSDVRARGADLTVDQYLQLTDKLRNLEKQSRLKNKLLKLNEKREEAGKLATVEAVVMEAKQDLEAHPSYKKSRSKEVINENSKKIMQRMSGWTSSVASALTNSKNIVVKMQREFVQGQHYDSLIQPLVDSETFKRDRIFQTKNQVVKFINDYGKDDYRRAFHEEIVIPEFEGFKHLGNGSMVKADLWTLFAYLGDPDARERMSNFKHSETGRNLSDIEIRNVLEKHLDHKDAKMAQNFVNIFKSFEDEAFELHFRNTGVEPTMVKGVPIEFKGRVYEGGYVPNKYLNADSTQEIDRYLELLGKKEAALFGNKEERGQLYAALRSAEMTDQGRLIERKNNSTLALDSNFMNIIGSFEEHIHDIAYRESGRDVLTLLKNPVYKEAIKGVVGAENYDVLVNSTIETVGKTSNDDLLSPFSNDHKKSVGLYKYFEQNFSVAQLGLNLNSVIMQGLSLGTAKLRMGKNGGRYITKAFGQLLKSGFDYKKFWNQVIEINPDLQWNKDNVDDTLTASIYDVGAKIGIQSNSGNLLRRGRDFVRDTSMYGLQRLDVIVKSFVSLAAYNQHMDGKVEGQNLKELSEMSFEQRHKAAKTYVKRISDLALTTNAKIDKSGIEKIAMSRIFTRFYTDSRSQLNTIVSQGRKINLAASEGDYGRAGYEAMSLLAVTTLTRAYIDSLYDEENPFNTLDDVNNLNDLGNYLTDSVAYAATSPISTLTGVTPIARDVQFALGGWFERKQASTWLGRSLSDLSTGISGLKELLKGEGLSKTEKKAALFTIGYGFGLPINGPLKIKEAIEETEIGGDFGNWFGKELRELDILINNFSEKHKDDPSKQEFITGLKDVQKQLIPTEGNDLSNIEPEEALEKLKASDTWNHYNPKTGGAGIYEFTEDRWEEISELAPDLNLSENGRVSQNTSEQEKAMKWEIEQNTKSFLNLQIEPTMSNLFGAHRFGIDDYALILLSPDNESLDDVVTNPDLFEGFSTVKDVKNFVKKQLN